MTEQGQTALRYARSGWLVIPIWPVRQGVCSCGTACGKNAGKHPLSDLVRRGLHEASKDEAVVRRWWDRFPDANIGIVTGSLSGIFALDQDAKSGGETSLRELESQHVALPDTFTVQTPNGGQHLYFKHPGGHVRNSVSTIGTGLDVRGDFGYVVAPPSTLGENRAYVAVDPDAAVVDAPAWLVELVTGARAEQDPLEIAGVLNGVPEGQRDMALWRAACKLRAAGVPQDMADELVRAAARKCEPPFDEELAASKVERAYQAYTQNYPTTDVGNSERLVDRHGDNIRYTNSGAWYAWDGTKWNGDQDGLVMTLAIETTKAMITQALQTTALTEAEQAARDSILRWGFNSQAEYRLSAFVTLAKTDPTVFLSVDAFNPDPMLLNCPNGTVNLRTGSMRPHNRSDLITKIAGVPYDPDARCPKWEAMLEQIIPDTETRAFLHRALGYSITGSVAEQCLFFLYGTGANGKSTVVKTIQKILGQYARVGSPDLLIQNKGDNHPTALADLVGARFVPTIETDEGKRMAEAQMKWLTGGDRLKARRMHQDYFEFDAHFKIWLAANHRPVIYGTDLAVWRRIHLIPFVVSIPPENRIRDYELVLLGEEAQGILRWAVEGAALWARDGLAPPAVVRAATDDYRDEMDIVGQFLGECLEPDEGHELLANDLYSAYSGWVKLNGEQAQTQRRFSNKITELGYRRDRGTANKYYWKDVALTEAGRDYAAMGLSRAATDTATLVASFRSNP